MPDAPVTLEGWYTLHEIFGVDRGRWNALSASERTRIIEEAAAVLETLVAPSEGHGALYALLSQKGDVCLLHWRPTLEALHAAQTAFARTRLRGYLEPRYSYLAV